MNQIRFFVRIIAVLWLTVPALTAAEPIMIRALDMSEIEGVPGLVLLVRSNQSRKVQAYVTGADGSVIVQPLGGDICTVTSFDPSGLFYNRTTEFDCHSSPVTLVLPARPIIDKVALLGSINLRIYDHKGHLLSGQTILLRTATAKFDDPYIFSMITDTKGSINAQLSSGDYILATLIDGVPYEAKLLVTAQGQKCPNTSQSCVSLSPRTKAAKPIDVHLSIPAVMPSE